MARTCNILLLLLSFLALTTAAPRHRQINTDVVQEQFKTWLVKYGYLRNSVDVTSLEHINAIVNMQSFHNLPVTGIVGEEEYVIMQRPRCGFPDMVGDEHMWGSAKETSEASNRVRRYSINRDRNTWDHTSVTYRFINFTSDLPSSEQIFAVEKSAQKWSAVSGLTISQSTSTTADIDISFNRRLHGDDFQFDGRSGILAHAFFPGSGLGGDIHFDDDEFFTTRQCTGGADFTYVALHELGHSLGLEHSNIPDAVMSTTFVCTTDIQLHSDDIAGIQSLYGAPSGGTVVTSNEVTPPSQPICNKVYDAIADSGTSFFLFHEERLFQANNQFLSQSQPLNLERVFSGGPTNIDAAFVSGSVITMFKGFTYWKYSLSTLQPEPSTPSSIADFGLSLTSIDAVLNTFGQLTFFKDNFYWTYSSSTGLSGSFIIQETWPQLIASASSPLTSVFYRQTENQIYFVSGSQYWAYTPQRQLVTSGDFNDITADLCRWCQSLSASAPKSRAPSVLLITIVISGFLHSWGRTA